MGLIEAWSDYARNLEKMGPPYVLPSDEEIIRESPRHADLNEAKETYEAALEAPWYHHDASFHFGLIPQPYMGDICNAEIYILAAGPGIHSEDYIATYKCRELRNKLISNLKQLENDPPRFIWLDPQLSWHDAHKYWKKRRKLNDTIGKLKKRTKDPEKKLKKRMALIELIPYHSRRSRQSWPPEWKKLPSSDLALDFVRKVVVPRVTNRKAIVIVGRRVGTWKDALPKEEPGIIFHDNPRKMHLSPDSDAGKAIIKWATQHWSD